MQINTCTNLDVLHFLASVGQIRCWQPSLSAMWPVVPDYLTTVQYMKIDTRHQKTCHVQTLNKSDTYVCAYHETSSDGMYLQNQDWRLEIFNIMPHYFNDNKIQIDSFFLSYMRSCLFIYMQILCCEWPLNFPIGIVSLFVLQIFCQNFLQPFTFMLFGQKSDQL